MQSILDALQPTADQWYLTPLQRAILHVQRSRVFLQCKSDTNTEVLSSALTSLDKAEQLLPFDGGELAQTLADVYKDVGHAYLWPSDKQPVRSPEAIRALVRATHLAPADHYTWYDLGVCYAKLSEYDQAIISLQQAIDLDPSDAIPHYNLGIMYLYLKQYEDASTAFQQAIKLNPTNPAPYHSLGNVYSLLERYEDGRRTYQRALELNPQVYQSMFSLARIERLTGNEDQVVPWIERARQLLPDNDFYNLACLESIAGNVEAALEALRIALERQEALIEWAREDPDFAFIRDDPHYRKLVELDSTEAE